MSGLKKAITLGLLGSKRARKTALNLLLASTPVLVISGSTFLNNFLASEPIAFILYWLAVAWITLAMALLAIFELLTLRSEANKARQP